MRFPNTTWESQADVYLSIIFFIWSDVPVIIANLLLQLILLEDLQKHHMKEVALLQSLLFPMITQFPHQRWNSRQKCGILTVGGGGGGEYYE